MAADAGARRQQATGRPRFCLRDGEGPPRWRGHDDDVPTCVYKQGEMHKCPRITFCSKQRPSHSMEIESCMFTRVLALEHETAAYGDCDGGWRALYLQVPVSRVLCARQRVDACKNLHTVLLPSTQALHYGDIILVELQHVARTRALACELAAWG